MSNTFDKIMSLTRQLYPTGRAWKLPFLGYFESLHRALAVDEEQCYNDAVSIQDVLIPDNDGFTVDDATDWERRLTIYSAPGTLFTDRKLAIYRKMAAPGKNPARGYYLYIQQQLQAAGFNVYVYENKFPLYPTGYQSLAPNTIYLFSQYFSKFKYNQAQYNQRKYGGYYNNMVANSIYQAQDNNFKLGGTFNCTFFIGGPTLGSLANVPAVREIEFRQLILRLKRLHTIAFLYVNYI